MALDICSREGRGIVVGLDGSIWIISVLQPEEDLVYTQYNAKNHYKLKLKH